MLRVRRLYFYLVCYLSLSMLLTGLATLLHVLLEQIVAGDAGSVLPGALTGRDQFREQTAFGIALTVIGLPVWLLHWRSVQGWLRGPRGEDERRSALRRLYLYGVLATTALAAYVAARDLLEHLIGLPLGLSVGGERLLGLLRPIPYLAAAALGWSYHWRVATRDRQSVGEEGASATLRRWYVYGLAALGVVPLMVNLTTLGYQFWRALFETQPLAAVGPSAVAHATASSGSTVIVALLVWLVHRGWSEGAASATSWYGERERRSVLRKVYLYLLVAGTVSWALVNAGQVLRFVLLSLLGESIDRVGGEPAQVALGRPLASILVFGLFWAFYWRSLRQEARSEPEVGRQASVRRLYYYLVSAISLAILAGSLASLLRLLVDLAILGPPLNSAGMRQELAGWLSTLTIALPVWLVHWTRAQSLVRADEGQEETRSTTRRWYLYLVTFAGVATLLVCGAWLLYDLIVVLLGRTLDRQLQAELGRLLANAAVAGVLLWYHWWLVLRADLAALRQLTPERTFAALVSGLDAAQLQALQAFSRESLPGASLRVVGDGSVAPEAEHPVAGETQMPR
jgi:hypothetical protein